MRHFAGRTSSSVRVNNLGERRTGKSVVRETINTIMTTANSITDDDLLLAVRYVLNECDRNELATFEARLADDPMAQAALVEAVQIVVLLQATPCCEAFALESRPLESSLQAASVSRKPAAPSRRSWQIASLVAASLLVAVVLNWPTLPSPQDHPAITIATITNANESPALAQAWTALDPDHITSDDADPIDDTPVEVDSDVPDWLLTAVLVEAEQGATDENDQGFEEETQL